jgi:hypothetical protein
MPTLTPYTATPDAPWPPASFGWHAVLWDDELARERAATMLDQIPVWHYQDELTACGLYRFFCYETPVGTAVGALRYEGSGAMGQGNGLSLDPLSYVGSDQPGGGSSSGGAASDSGGTMTDGGSGGGSGGSNTGGQTTNEPVPSPDGSCASWVPDTSNAQAVGIANSISFHNTPVPWTDQGVYETSIGGVAWRFPMWWENGLKNVAAFRCATPGGGGAVTKAGMGIGPIIIGVLIVLGTVTAAVLGKGKILQHAHA